MNYKIAGEEHLLQLSEMTWNFHLEVNKHVPEFEKQVYLSECIDFLRSGLVNKEWVYWVAEDKGEIVSQLYIRKIRKVPKPKKSIVEFGLVTNVYTKPSVRGNGIGKLLLEYVKEWALENRLEFLILWPSEKAVSFYEREGFKQNGEIMELLLNRNIG